MNTHFFLLFPLLNFHSFRISNKKFVIFLLYCMRAYVYMCYLRIMENTKLSNWTFLFPWRVLLYWKVRYRDLFRWKYGGIDVLLIKLTDQNAVYLLNKSRHTRWTVAFIVIVLRNQFFCHKIFLMKKLKAFQTGFKAYVLAFHYSCHWKMLSEM